MLTTFAFAKDDVMPAHQKPSFPPVFWTVLSSYDADASGEFANWYLCRIKHPNFPRSKDWFKDLQQQRFAIWESGDLSNLDKYELDSTWVHFITDQADRLSEDLYEFLGMTEAQAAKPKDLCQCLSPEIRMVSILETVLEKSTTVNSNLSLLLSLVKRTVSFRYVSK